jgi:hypothetical protein
LKIENKELKDKLIQQENQESTIQQYKIKSENLQIEYKKILHYQKISNSN